MAASTPIIRDAFASPLPMQIGLSINEFLFCAMLATGLCRFAWRWKVRTMLFWFKETITWGPVRGRRAGLHVPCRRCRLAARAIGIDGAHAARR